MASSKSSISARCSRMFSPLASHRSMRWAKAGRGAIPTRLAIAPGAARNNPDSAAPHCLRSSSAVKNRSAFQNFAIVSSAKALETIARQLSIAHRVRNVLVIGPGLQPRRSAQILADEILHRRERVFGVRRTLAALRSFLWCRFLLCRFLLCRDLAVLLFR